MTWGQRATTVIGKVPVCRGGAQCGRAASESPESARLTSRGGLGGGLSISETMMT